MIFHSFNCLSINPISIDFNYQFLCIHTLFLSNLNKIRCAASSNHLWTRQITRAIYALQFYQHPAANHHQSTTTACHQEARSPSKTVILQKQKKQRPKLIDPQRIQWLCPVEVINESFTHLRPRYLSPFHFFFPGKSLERALFSTWCSSSWGKRGIVRQLITQRPPLVCRDPLTDRFPFYTAANLATLPSLASRGKTSVSRPNNHLFSRAPASNWLVQLMEIESSWVELLIFRTGRWVCLSETQGYIYLCE